MRGHQAISDYTAKTGRRADAIFIFEGKSSCDSFGSLQASKNWFPEIVLGKSEPVAEMDFSCLDGHLVLADLSENYNRSFRICVAITQGNPLRLIATIAGDHPLLEWNPVQGFFENE